MSGGDGLREAIGRVIFMPNATGDGEARARTAFADAVLALPEVAALRAKAAAADRVRELHRAIDPEGYPEWNAEAEAYCASCGYLWPCWTTRVLDGDAP